MNKNIFFRTFLLTIIISINIQAQLNVELVSHINPSSNSFNDIWGYVDSSGNEYAILGASNGTYIISLINPSNPAIISFIPGPNSTWRDMKVHSHYAYIVTEGTGNGQGLQIIDLSQLPASATLVNTDDTHFARAHNIFIDNGYAYVIGTNDGGGMHILDLADPVNPVRTSYYMESGYIHDVYVWNDTVVACAEDSYHLVDVTDKFNPFKISQSIIIPGIYAHSGWMTEDKRYFYGTEEFNSRDITVWDLQDRTNWNLVIPSWQTSSNATVHNLFILGNYAHISYYSDGYVVLDVSSPEAPYMIGHYDTPSAWGCYPYLPSGLTLISDIPTGLYVLNFTPDDVPPSILHTEFDVVLNPDPVTIQAHISDNGDILEANLFYRTISDNDTSNWTLTTDPNGPSGTLYEFEIPGFSHLTKVQYYIAALDDSDNVTTLPPGGSGKNPAGSNPPSQFFDYDVIVSGPPQILSTTPSGDTTVVVLSEFNIIVDAQDTTGLSLEYSWTRNGSQSTTTTNIYFYRAIAIPPPPRVDTIKVIVSNGYYSTEKKWLISVEPATNIEDEDNKVISYNLQQNYPNPFNPATTISFSIPQNEFVNISIYNVIGEIVAELVNDNFTAGKYEVQFDAGNLTSGIYFTRIQAGSYNKLIKMTLLK